MTELVVGPPDQTPPKPAAIPSTPVTGSSTGSWANSVYAGIADAFCKWFSIVVSPSPARSDYLVHGVEEDRFAGGEYKGNPYPTGEERANINGAFDRLVNTIETKETDGGNVAMFSRTDSLGGMSSEQASISASELQRFADSIRNDGIPKVMVADTIADLPKTAQRRIRSEGIKGVRGMFDKDTGTIWLVREKLSDLGEAQFVLLHEAFHRGLLKTLGEDAEKVLDRIYLTNNDVRTKADVLSKQLKVSRLEATEEVLADMAGDGVVRNLKGWDLLVKLIRSFISNLGIKLAFTNEMIQDLVAGARAVGLTGDTQDNSDEFFAHAKSDKTTIQGIADDNGLIGEIKTITGLPGRTQYNISLPNDGVARIVVRHANPYGESLYGYDVDENGEMQGEVQGRPGENAESVPLKDDVWVDVSLLKTGSDGSKIYSIAATYAHNTDKIFIGDPAGLSDEALRRRTEQMLSSALKFETTDHIAPHPRQISGDSKLRVPPLRWVYGDHDGNFERMVDVSIKSLENAFPGSKLIAYNPTDGTFYRTDTGEPFTSRSELARLVGQSITKRRAVAGSAAEKGQAGWRTVARVALLRAVRTAQRDDAGTDGRGLLDRVRQDVARLRVDPATGQSYNKEDRFFYSRSGDLLTSYTPEEAKQKQQEEEAARKAEAEKPKAPTGRKVTADQVDLFNPQSSLFSRTQVIGQTHRQHTPEQLQAMKNVGFQVEVPTLKERAQALWKDAGKKMAQGIVDQFAPVKDMDKEAYGLLRLAKGASGALEAFLHGGRLKLTDGVYDFDDQNKGGVVDKLLIPLQGEHHDFMRWIAANRAERLTAEGKENLFSPEDIKALKTLASGTTGFDYTVQTGPNAGKVTRDRTQIYADSLRVFNGFNKNILDMAEQSGLIDGESRKVWEHEFYVPFYRVADDSEGGVRGMNIKGSVVRQQAFKLLKGGKQALNDDLLDNTLMNWAHLLDASAKNRAAKATIEAAEKMGVASGGNQSTLSQMGSSIGNKNGVVWFMDQGQKRYSLVDDQYLLTALGALEYAGMRNPVMDAMSSFKHALTMGVTASPFFKVRNLIRDSVQVIGTSKIGWNPAANVAQGWKLTDPKSDEYFRLLAGGGTIHFGTMMEGSEGKRVQALVESGVDDATILNSQHKVKQFYRKFIEPSITAYNELGNRGEAINRATLYDQLRKQGMSHAEASLQARDLMDFSMQGSFTTIRFLTQVVPFFNARLQGLYKLGRSAKEDPARFSAVLGATALFSLALLAAYGDDDDWKKREEWDRNNFWWFKFGGQAFRIPKPFEIGAIATLAERGFELAFDKEMTGKRFRQQVMTLLSDNLSMNPVPQLIKPIVDVYANKDSFSGRPIETMGMERLKSEYRFNDRTSMTARALSTASNSVTGLVGVESASPVQIDHMLRGYFGWLGSFIVGAGDVVARPATGQTEHASPDMWKVATGGMVSDLRDAPSRYVSQMYTQAKEIEQAYGTYRSLLKEGKAQEARDFATDNREDLAKYHHVERVKRQESLLNERIRLIERSNMNGDAKRDLIRSIQIQKDRVSHAVN